MLLVLYFILVIQFHETDVYFGLFSSICMGIHLFCNSSFWHVVVRAHPDILQGWMRFNLQIYHFFCQSMWCNQMYWCGTGSQQVSIHAHLDLIATEDTSVFCTTLRKGVSSFLSYKFLLLQDRHVCRISLFWLGVAVLVFFKPYIIKEVFFSSGFRSYS